MEIKFKKLDDNAKKPIRATNGAAGYDFYVQSVEIKSDNYGDVIFICKTGIAIEVPEGYFLALFPRSSVMKLGVTLANCVGVVDEDYRGEIQGRFKTTRPINSVEKEMVNKYALTLLDRPFQGILIKYTEIEFQETRKLSDTDRDEGGFGSTNKKK